MPGTLSHRVRRLSRMELAGAGQIYITGTTAYVGHITNRAHPGTSSLDVSDPREPKLLAQLSVEEPDSHSHKVRVRSREGKVRCRSLTARNGRRSLLPVQSGVRK